MDSHYRRFHSHPRRPRFVAPSGAVDAHCHVFGPVDRFPFAPTRKYTPCDAPKEVLFALRDHLGFCRNVIVQASCHGTNNDALVDALRAADGLARGVAVVSPDILDEELQELDAAGVRAVRFNFVKRLVDVPPEDELLAIAKRVAALGWHVVVYLEAADLTGLTPFLEKLPCIVVLDHMGRPDVAKGAGHGQFKAFVELLERNENFWTKVSCPERLSVSGPRYQDVIPFGRTLVEMFGDRVLWGTDWPHPNMKSHMPDDGALVDFIPMVAVDRRSQHLLLVDNPMRLYWRGAQHKRGTN